MFVSVGLFFSTVDTSLYVRTFQKYRYLLDVQCPCVSTRLIKRCRVQSLNHKRCDTMEFWEDSTDKLVTQFRILISKIFSLLRRFWIRFGCPVLILSQRCPRKEASLPASQKTIRWLVSFIVFAVYTTTFFQLHVGVFLIEMLLVVSPWHFFVWALS